MNRRTFLKNTSIITIASLITPNIIKADNNTKWISFKDETPNRNKEVIIIQYSKEPWEYKHQPMPYRRIFFIENFNKDDMTLINIMHFRIMQFRNHPDIEFEDKRILDHLNYKIEQYKHHKDEKGQFLTSKDKFYMTDNKNAFWTYIDNIPNYIPKP